MNNEENTNKPVVSFPNRFGEVLLTKYKMIELRDWKYSIKQFGLIGMFIGVEMLTLLMWFL